MIDNNETFDRIVRLLHDFTRAKDGAVFARRMRDVEAAKSLLKKAQQLLIEANALDPEHAAPAWEELQP